ncbi:phosphatase PAP2 family protein [Motilibacter aurantiacus]|uniref:phosphatase PAP2 family protein n=1 Tax=Motilibacter aurantiacus TaxID=2714955 RepID=UPI00140E3ADC|nr:phosphatase PAP2 family protein [Motilibacter aurantiacus]NHC44257.1 phosphatase PAP2 family protein [Motilibacter aurantiacus]
MTMPAPDLRAAPSAPVSADAGAGAVRRWLDRPRPTWWQEALLLLGMLLAYDVIRLAATDDLGVALRHAGELLDVERALGLHVEATLNSAVAGHRWLEVAASYWYAALHYTVTPAVLVLLWWRRPGEYRRLRAALVVPTAVALVGYLAYPTAPPRLVAGYTDVLLATSDVGWWAGHGGGVRGASQTVNQLAAMPSMHVGWALWCGLVLAHLAPRPWLRALALAYPATTALVVVVTANHWVLDAVAGAALILVAWAALVRRTAPLAAPRPRPAGPAA